MSEVDPFAKARQTLVEASILSSGVTDQRVLKAFLTVPRHEFVFPQYRDQAYAEGPLPIRRRLYQTGKRLGRTPDSCKMVTGISRIIQPRATSSNQNSHRQCRTMPTITTRITSTMPTRTSVARKEDDPFEHVKNTVMLGVPSLQDFCLGVEVIRLLFGTRGVTHPRSEPRIRSLHRSGGTVVTSLSGTCW
jgi:hypothetical protein